MRHGIGIDRIMWGTDYPHPEGSWPNTKEKMEKYLSGIPEPELVKMLGGNAIECYDLDIDALSRIAARIGPEKSRFA